MFNPYLENKLQDYNQARILLENVMNSICRVHMFLEDADLIDSEDDMNFQSAYFEVGTILSRVEGHIKDYRRRIESNDSWN